MLHTWLDGFLEKHNTPLPTWASIPPEPPKEYAPQNRQHRKPQDTFEKTSFSVILSLLKPILTLANC